MPGRVVILLLLFLAALVHSVFAQERVPQASAQERAERGVSRPDRPLGEERACRLAEFATGTVAAVVDGRSFVLADGGEIRLAGIEAPTMRPQDPPERAQAGEAARAALVALVAGKSLVLKHLTPATDRYGRRVAFAFVAGGERSLQADLLAQGWARAAVNGEAGPCAAELSTAERQARGAKLGLWSDPYYVVRQAEHPAEVSAERGRFTLVKGKVVSVRESGGTIYVNFGRRWSEDFTVTILKRNERLFNTAGLEPKSLRGRIVEVRGYVEERGGPWIEAVRPEQITVVNAE
jgi:endonuclease YncB( thermonuclease family)